MLAWTHINERTRDVTAPSKKIALGTDRPLYPFSVAHRVPEA
jgi:hypothetical protein